MIIAVRVEPRLLHAQIVNLWQKYWQADRYVIIDNKTAANKALKAIFSMAAGDHIQLTFMKENDDLSSLDQQDSTRTVILVRSFAILNEILQQGLQLDCTVSYGWIAKKQLQQPQESQSLMNLYKMNLEVINQNSPSIISSYVTSSYSTPK